MYRLRFLRMLLMCLLAKKRGLLEEYDLTFRVLPLFDTDVTRVLTQAYAAFSGLGRWHYVFSSEVGPVAFKSKWFPVTRGETFTFLRSINNFEKVRVRTQLVGWNQQCFFLKQTFFVRDEIRAVSYTEGVVRGPQGHLTPQEAFGVFGRHMQSPTIPDEFLAWHAVQNHVRAPFGK